MTDRLTQRHGTPKDASAIRLFTRKAYAGWVEILGREPLPMRADYAAALKAHRFDLLYEGDTLCALIETDIRRDSLWIENIAVAPHLHGKGLGRALLDMAKGLAQEAGCQTLTLYTNAKMTRNITIYERYGFKIDREEAMEHGTVVHMSMEV